MKSLILTSSAFQLAAIYIFLKIPVLAERFSEQNVPLQPKNFSLTGRISRRINLKLAIQHWAKKQLQVSKQPFAIVRRVIL